MEAYPAPDSSSSSDDAPDSAPPPSSARPGDGSGPLICLTTGLRDGFAGGVLGSVFGFGQGLWKRQGFKGSLKEAGSSAKMFALLSGVHTLVSCCLRKIRGKQDALNAGIAGCATGLALSTPGSPDAMLRSCVTFAAFSYIMERFNQPAIACTLQGATSTKGNKRQVEERFSFHVLPPFVLPPMFVQTLEFTNQQKALYRSLKL